MVSFEYDEAIKAGKVRLDYMRVPRAYAFLMEKEDSFTGEVVIEVLGEQFFEDEADAIKAIEKLGYLVCENGRITAC